MNGTLTRIALTLGVSLTLSAISTGQAVATRGCSCRRAVN